MVSNTGLMSPSEKRQHVARLGNRVFDMELTTARRDGAFDELVRLSRDPTFGRPQVEVGLVLTRIGDISVRYGDESRAALREMRKSWEEQGV